MVDTCAAEFDSETPYFYSTYGWENESIKSDKESVLVLGSGPIRIGQGVEFDYATVHSVKAIQAAGYEAIIMNSNPETVSTDFSVSDKLYFEPLTFEDVMNVIDLEQPKGVIVQFGGQTAINLAEPLAKAGVTILVLKLRTWTVRKTVTSSSKPSKTWIFHNLLDRLQPMKKKQCLLLVRSVPSSSSPFICLGWTCYGNR